jgi:hypothetical protein
MLKSKIDIEKEIERAKGAVAPLDVETMSLDQLLKLRAEIDGRLPASSLKDIDLEHELVVQFITVKNLQSSVIDDKDVQANQKAQVANSCASTLQQLVKMQTEFYTAERFKEIENHLIASLRDLPPEASEQFLDAYERMGK